jgi:hypothetical protein
MRSLADVVLQNPRRAACERDQTTQGANERSLARAVRTKEAEYLSLADSQTNTIHGRE